MVQDSCQARVTQPGRLRGQQLSRACRRTRRGNAQRQRQVPAEPDHLAHGFGLGGDSHGTQTALQQFPCVLFAEQVQGEQVRAVGHAEPGESAAGRPET
jgi:hypothetical protein